MTHDAPSSQLLRLRRTPDDLRRELARTRAEVTASVDELRREVALSTDWRTWVRHRPMTVVAGAFVLGFFMGRR